MIERVWSLWTGLTRVSMEAPKPGEICVVVSPESLLCPRGWVGIVRIEEATLATVPDGQMVDRVRLALQAAGRTRRAVPVTLRPKGCKTG